MQNQKPLISIIVPVYNAEKYLPACLDSICNQTLRELEIIVVDDGSTDGSGKIADEYALADSRIQVVHKRNGNPGATRNVGLELMTGEYVGFIDGDDWIEPDMYRNLYRQAEADHSDVVITGVKVEFTRDKRYLLQQFNQTSVSEEADILKLFFQLHDLHLSAYPVNKIYRKSVLKQGGIRFPELLPYEDLIFNLNVFQVAKRISLIPGTPYHYMRRDILSAAGAYSPVFLKACKLAEDTFRSFFNHFNYPDQKAETFLRARRIANYSGYVSMFHKENCPLGRMERIGCLRHNLFDNPSLFRDIRLSSPNGFYERLFYFFLKFTNPLVMDTSYRFLFFLRRNCDPVYRQFRKIISK